MFQNSKAFKARLFFKTDIEEVEAATFPLILKETLFIIRRLRKVPDVIEIQEPLIKVQIKGKKREIKKFLRKMADYYEIKQT